MLVEPRLASTLAAAGLCCPSSSVITVARRLSTTSSATCVPLQCARQARLTPACLLLLFRFSSFPSLPCSLCLSVCLPASLTSPLRHSLSLHSFIPPTPAKIKKKPLALTLLGLMCLLSGIPGRARKVPISPFFFHPFTKCLGTVVQSSPRWMTR